jgi:hypothetical protein
MGETMNDDSFVDAGRRIARQNEWSFGASGTREAAEHAASLAARWLLSLTVGLAVAWTVIVAVPAFSGLLAAAVVGYGLLWLVPWLVVTGVVRVLETTA